MDSHHSIHTLAAIASGNSKQQLMQHQFHNNTLQHNSHHTQPLVNAGNQNHQLLQFHHPAGTPPVQTTTHHPYSTLHHIGHHQQQQQHQLISQLQHLNNATGNPQANSHFGNFHHQSSSQNSASSQATLAAQHQHYLQHQHLFGTQDHQKVAAMLGHTNPSGSSHSAGSQQASSSNGNSQQAYNMNSSDYSSSTYHVYDQILGDQIIDDLIVIKQERMKKKLEQEHRRKVILFSLAVILLVGLLMFLLVQLFRTSSSSSSGGPATPGSLNTLPAFAIQQQRETNNILQQMPNDQIQQQQQQQFGPGRMRTPWAPPIDGQPKPNWQFDPTQYSSQAPILRQQQQQQQPMSPVFTDDNNYGQQQQTRNRVIMSGDQQQADSAAGQQQQQQLVKCLVSNCNSNGQCNSFGRCQCYPGFMGAQCEFRVPQVPAILAPQQKFAAGQSADQTGQPVDTLCALMLNNCNGNGQCTQQGRCKCLPGFMGDSCQLRDLCLDRSCSNQGLCRPETGLCECKFGFKGAECEQRDEETWQRLLNCSHHGKYDYLLKRCNCDQGFSGSDCSEEKCEPSAFLAGAGNNSEQQHQAGVDCGQNGLFDCQAKRCVCRDGYSGDRCQVQQCSAQCLRNGQCLNGTCVCQMGFYGRHCTFNGCPNQCSGRGQCVKTTTTAAVASASATSQATASQQQAALADSSSGQQQAEWRCQCPPGTTGDDCGTLIERQCDDGIDNDLDGLVDCADSECCGDSVCQNSTLCMKSPDPLDILMRKQPPPPTSSFFQRMQFLIEKFSSQIYSNLKDFNDSRASVIRGRVTYQKQGITGVRVSVADQSRLGITLTRDNGHFDLMVNGGGAVVVEFRREPFAILRKTIRVPWNEIVLMDSIELQLDSGEPQAAPSSPLPEPDTPICSAHNYRLMRPLIVASPRSTRRSHSASRTGAAAVAVAGSQAAHQQRAVILRDSATVQQTIAIPNSAYSSPAGTPTNESVSIVYISSRANEFMSTIHLQLTPPAGALLAGDKNQHAEAKSSTSEDLKLIHVRIVIEGNLFEQTFEPQTNLTFDYGWNRRNVYRQKSFGLSTASVSVGYEYFDCKHVIWSTKHIQLPGHDLSISDIGNQWNLNIHHRYNYRDSILQRGDGHNYNLKSDKPRVVQFIMGDGYQRQPNCPFCDGASSPVEQKLLKPQALVSGPDGSLYVGDFNLIRRIEPAASSGASQADRVVRTVLEMGTNRVPNKYALAMNLADSSLYMSDAERHQILLVRERDSAAINESASDTDNLIPVVGSGAKCQLDGDTPDRLSMCGDGQPARVARLIEPRALAFDLNGRMYLADGPNVRLVDTDQKIHTILGDYGMSRHSKFPCTGEALPMHKFIPRAPVDLAVSPLDETLHILDDNVVYKITQDKRVQVVAGRLAHCLPASTSEQSAGKSARQTAPRATEVQLQAAQSIVFNQNGDLFISEDDQKQSISRVLVVSPEEDTISLYAGLPVESAGSRLPSVNEPSVEEKLQEQLQEAPQRSTNVLQSNQLTRATDYKFNSIAAIAVDQQGNLILADKIQLRVLSIEPDLPQINAAGEYEIQSPDNADELLVFNRHGHHVATRELAAGQASQRAGPNKYTFSYNVNTSLGQLALVSCANGNKITIYRDGPHHSVKMIETAFGGQCKLDISRNGQVHSIATLSPNRTQTNLSYHIDGGLLKQSRDQTSGEVYDFMYDEFGRALAIRHSWPKSAAEPVECSLQRGSSVVHGRHTLGSHVGQLCNSLIVTE